MLQRNSRGIADKRDNLIALREGTGDDEAARQTGGAKDCEFNLRPPVGFRRGSVQSPITC